MSQAFFNSNASIRQYEFNGKANPFEAEEQKEEFDYSKVDFCIGETDTNEFEAGIFAQSNYNNYDKFEKDYDDDNGWGGFDVEG